MRLWDESDYFVSQIENKSNFSKNVNQLFWTSKSKIGLAILF